MDNTYDFETEKAKLISGIEDCLIYSLHDICSICCNDYSKYFDDFDKSLDIAIGSKYMAAYRTRLSLMALIAMYYGINNSTIHNLFVKVTKDPSCSIIENVWDVGNMYHHGENEMFYMNRKLVDIFDNMNADLQTDLSCLWILDPIIDKSKIDDYQNSEDRNDYYKCGWAAIASRISNESALGHVSGKISGSLAKCAIPKFEDTIIYSSWMLYGAITEKNPKRITANIMLDYIQDEKRTEGHRSKILFPFYKNIRFIIKHITDLESKAAK